MDEGKTADPKTMPEKKVLSSILDNVEIRITGTFTPPPPKPESEPEKPLE